MLMNLSEETLLFLHHYISSEKRNIWTTFLQQWTLQKCDK